jgi:hypothetical protein
LTRISQVAEQHNSPPTDSSPLAPGSGPPIIFKLTQYRLSEQPGAFLNKRDYLSKAGLARKTSRSVPLCIAMHSLGNAYAAYQRFHG